MKKVLISVSLVSFMALAFVPAALAQVDVPGPGSQITPPEGVPTTFEGTGNTVLGLVAKITRWAALLFWALTIIFILWSAFLYLTAAGDAEKVKKASTNLLYAVIAMVIALVATAIPFLVENVVTT